MDPNRTGPIQRATDGRDSSRKWRLVVGGILLYTFVHLINAAAVLVALWKQWLADGGAVSLWTHSLTTWSAGVIFFAGLYKAANVAQKWGEHRNGGK
jgi:hypothetical protein